MELYKELLINVLQNQKIEVSFPDLEMDVKKISELKCYQALCQIKEVLEDDTLEDSECFEKIERIVCIFEDNFGSLSYRHDF